MDYFQEGDFRENESLHTILDRITNELHEEKEKCEELREAKQETLRQLLALQDEHDKEIEMLKSDLIEEVSSKEGLEKKLNDLRAEVSIIIFLALISLLLSLWQLERLQTENAAEWGKRERLETDKLTLERDNKKLRNELRDMQERLERKGSRTLNNSDVEIRHLQQELSDKSKVSTAPKPIYDPVYRNKFIGTGRVEALSKQAEESATRKIH